MKSVFALLVLFLSLYVYSFPSSNSDASCSIPAPSNIVGNENEKVYIIKNNSITFARTGVKHSPSYGHPHKTKTLIYKEFDKEFAVEAASYGIVKNDFNFSLQSYGGGNPYHLKNDILIEKNGDLVSISKLYINFEREVTLYRVIDGILYTKELSPLDVDELADESIKVRIRNREIFIY